MLHNAVQEEQFVELLGTRGSHFDELLVLTLDSNFFVEPAEFKALCI